MSDETQADLEEKYGPEFAEAFVKLVSAVKELSPTKAEGGKPCVRVRLVLEVSSKYRGPDEFKTIETTSPQDRSLIVKKARQKKANELNRKGILANRAQNYSGALELFREAARLDPENTKYRENCEGTKKKLGIIG